MSVWAIVLAGGRGARFGGRKQFAELDGRRLVDHAVHTATAACDAVVVVLPPDDRWDGGPVAAAVSGGVTRAASVRAGLAAVPHSVDVVVVTDAAHPVAPATLFTRVVTAVLEGAAAAVPGVVPADVVKRVAGGRVVGTLPRDASVLTQVPQAFRADVLRRAHAGGGDAVEDSALVEALGVPVDVVAGDTANIHVTDPLTLAFAGLVLRRTRA